MGRSEAPGGILGLPTAQRMSAECHPVLSTTAPQNIPSLSPNLEADAGLPSEIWGGRRLERVEADTITKRPFPLG